MGLSELREDCKDCCSKCKSKNLEWGFTEIEDAGTKQGWTCKDCGAEGYEFCNSVYACSAHLI